MRFSLHKIVIIALFVGGLFCSLQAQQEVQFTQYMFNRLTYNPAYAGSHGAICASLMYRSQWMGLQLDNPTKDISAGSVPTDYLFSVDLPIKVLHGGVGLTVLGEKLGYHNNIGINLDYAFRIYWGRGTLAAAIEANVFNSNFEYSQLVGSDDLTGDFSNPVTGSSSDPLLSSREDASSMLFDLSTGIYYQVPGTYYLGLSIKNLLGSKSEVLNYTNVRTIYLMGGYDYVLPFHPSFKLKPSLLAKTTQFTSWQLDLSCLLEYQNEFWLGAAYRIDDAVSILGGVNWEKLRVGLAYDLTTSKLGTFKSGRSKGTLELYLRYCFKIIIPHEEPSVYRNTRYLL
ncbi:MAG: type IX secretion system membrane protein PorP/SprF [Bacteroidales bacterium]|nr:type IX secretion system membrane protein PorP/SprF [Candidatus Colimorpha onthohippi]